MQNYFLKYDKISYYLLKNIIINFQMKTILRYYNFEM